MYAFITNKSFYSIILLPINLLFITDVCLLMFLIIHQLVLVLTKCVPFKQLHHPQRMNYQKVNQYKKYYVMIILFMYLLNY